MAADAGPRHRVLLVREWDQQVSGSGCCGRLNTASVSALCESAETPFAHSRADMQRVGLVFTALRERFDPDEVELTIVDPRNTVWLLPAIWRDARGRGLGVLSSLRQVSRGTAPCTIVCDGLVLLNDATAEQALTAVDADIRSRR